MSGEDTGGFYGQFASKLGSGAASVGKKAAQSEAGRSAGKSAIKGATDATAKDLTDRYFGDETTAVPKVPMNKLKPSQPLNQPSPSAKSTPTATIRTNLTDSDEEFEQVMLASSYQRTRADSQHSKPSVFQRYKPKIQLKGGDDKTKKQIEAARRERRSVKRNKIYKYAASVEADWSRLPQAMTLYNYRAEMPCDLEFRKGQIIQILTRTDSQNDWWEGLLDGRVGIFPANYVRLM